MQYFLLPMCRSLKGFLQRCQKGVGRRGNGSGYSSLNIIHIIYELVEGWFDFSYLDLDTSIEYREEMGYRRQKWLAPRAVETWPLFLVLLIGSAVSVPPLLFYDFYHFYPASLSVFPRIIHVYSIDSAFFFLFFLWVLSVLLYLSCRDPSTY